MEIHQDLYGIAERIKAIDPAYFVEYNGAKDQFELHSHRDRPTYVLSFPFGELDCRAVEHTLKTRVERHEALLREIEENNLKIEKDAMRVAKEQIGEAIDAETAR